MRHLRLLACIRVLLAAAGMWSQGWGDQIYWDVVASGGVVGSNSEGYVMSASVGQTGTVVLGGSTCRIHSGFWTPWLIDQVEVEEIRWLDLPTTYQLSQNYPNPFNNQTAIHYAVPRQSHVTMEIYDLLGHRVRLLTDTTHEPGYYFVRWNGANSSGRRASNGVYVCRMTARAGGGSSFSHSKQMLLLR
jgi:hypothetical protein